MNSQRQGKGLAFVSNQKDFCRQRTKAVRRRQKSDYREKEHTP